jgi:hypothetical protein
VTRLSILTGAPGSGKTTLTPGLRAALPGVVVLDMDEFLDAGSRLAGVDLASEAAADRWPAYDELCLTFVAAVLAAGHDVLLLCPLDPSQVDRPARWAVLDCSDATRASRLARRSPVDGLLEGALEDAAELRGLGFPVLVNDGLPIDSAVSLVTRWFLAELP